MLKLWHNKYTIDLWNLPWRGGFGVVVVRGFFTDGTLFASRGITPLIWRKKVPSQDVDFVAEWHRLVEYNTIQCY